MSDAAERCAVIGEATCPGGRARLGVSRVGRALGWVMTGQATNSSQPRCRPVTPRRHT